ncbi:MAG: class I SAM-dependent methyltransferase [Phycisphaerales bacterium JB063]
MIQPPRSYSHVAWCYDAAASAYSLGAIARAKRWHVGRVGSGDRVLYLGAGTGREVAMLCAAQPGAEVVCVEPCAAMAARLRRRLTRWTDRVTIIEEPLSEGVGGGAFDWVCGHFFFNVFDAAAMPRVVAMAASHVKPGGRMVFADFMPGGCSTTQRVLRSAYYRPLNLVGWGLGMCALHPIYDYAPVATGLGFEIEARIGLAVLPGTPALYEVICARKKQDG